MKERRKEAVLRGDPSSSRSVSTFSLHLTPPLEPEKKGRKNGSRTEVDEYYFTLCLPDRLHGQIQGGRGKRGKAAVSAVLNLHRDYLFYCVAPKRGKEPLWERLRETRERGQLISPTSSCQALVARAKKRGREKGKWDRRDDLRSREKIVHPYLNFFYLQRRRGALRRKERRKKRKEEKKRGGEKNSEFGSIVCSQPEGASATSSFTSTTPTSSRGRGRKKKGKRKLRRKLERELGLDENRCRALPIDYSLYVTISMNWGTERWPKGKKGRRERKGKKEKRASGGGPSYREKGEPASTLVYFSYSQSRRRR